MVRIAVLVSGSGTNLQALINAIENGSVTRGKIQLVVSDRDNAFALSRAQNHGILTKKILRKDFPDLDTFNRALITELKENKIDLVVLGGFLSILSPQFIKAFENRIINIHPSLIPAFCGRGYYGLTVHHKALEYGVKITGATAHFVTEEIDGGPIILQKAVEVPESIDAESLQKKVMEEAEWVILPEAVNLFCNEALMIDGRRVVIRPGPVYKKQINKRK